MPKLDASDIQGFAMRGYSMPFARYLLLELAERTLSQPVEQSAALDFLRQTLRHITNATRWDKDHKPTSTVNIAFTHKGLARLDLPTPTLCSFPVEFQQGMKARKDILNDTGRNAPERWDECWREDRVHAWMGVQAVTPEALEQRCAELQAIMHETGGTRLCYAQSAGALRIDGEFTSKEHFGYTDGFGNPDFEGAERKTVPGQGKLGPDGQWVPLATGEFLLGYPDEAGELPVAPVPHLLARNGTFMVYRKLHENVATFRTYLEEQGQRYAGGKEKLAAKFVGRWRDGTPIEVSPDAEDPALVHDPNRNTKFTYGGDPDGVRCPLGAHIRRTNPRDAFGFDGKLVNRRRITRRGFPYGEYVPEGRPVRDEDEHGVIFMVLNSSIFRQFEFVQQQWIEYGNDNHQGSDKDLLLGNHEGPSKVMIQGSTDPQNPPHICMGLPNFVELRGGDYFFVPSMTALRLMAHGSVDPR